MKEENIAIQASDAVFAEGCRRNLGAFLEDYASFMNDAVIKEHSEDSSLVAFAGFAAHGMLGIPACSRIPAGRRDEFGTAVSLAGMLTLEIRKADALRAEIEQLKKEAVHG